MKEADTYHARSDHEIARGRVSSCGQWSLTGAGAWCSGGDSLVVPREGVGLRNRGVLLVQVDLALEEVSAKYSRF